MKKYILVMILCILNTSFGAINVGFDDLIRSPEKYDGCEIAVVGFYYMKSPVSALFSSKKSFKAGRKRKSGILWIGANSESVLRSAIDRKNKKWVRVTGVFRRGPLGIFEQYQGQIDEITKMVVVSPQEIADKKQQASDN